MIEAPLPFGLDKTKEFISLIAEACGKQDLAAKLIKEEEKHLLPKLNWIIPHTFLDKKVAISGDPYTVEGLADVVEFLGAEAMALFCSSRAEHSENEWSKKFGSEPIFEPTLNLMQNTFENLQANDNLDFIIGESTALAGMKNFKVPLVEFGVPSFFTHYYLATPFLGYRGFEGLVQRMLNSISILNFINYDQ